MRVFPEEISTWIGRQRSPSPTWLGIIQSIEDPSRTKRGRKGKLTVWAETSRFFCPGNQRSRFSGLRTQIKWHHGFPSLQLTDNRSWGFLWRTLTSTPLVQKCFYVSYLLLCNKNDAELMALNSIHLWSHSFIGSGVPTWRSWVRCSASNQAANHILAKLHSFLEPRVLFQSRVAVGRIQFFVIVWLRSGLLNRCKLGVFLSASCSLLCGPLTMWQLTSSRLSGESVSSKESSLWPD